jgi:hypothetical protein
MGTKKIGLFLMCGLATLTILAPVIYGDYHIVWSTIDGGGGYSSGGQCIVAGTIGQPDAAYSEGGQYELLGGFWPGGPQCIVAFDDFALFAGYWLESGQNLPADLDHSGTVDIYDLREFVLQWLYYCPYGWPLR